MEARRLRTTLSARDQAILDAVTPYFDTETVQERDAATDIDRLIALEQRFPGDAEIAFVTGGVMMSYGALQPLGDATGKELVEGAGRSDPTFASVDWWLGQLDQDPAARKRYDERCLEVAPQAGSCYRNLAWELAAVGDCHGYVDVAKRNLAVEPESLAAVRSRLDSLVASGGGRLEADALGAKLSSLDAKLDPSQALSRWLRTLVLAHYGAFDEIATVIAPLGVESDGWRHGLLALVDDEKGDAQRAVEEARMHLAQRAVAVGIPGTPDHEPPRYIDGEALALLVHAKEMTVFEARAKAEEWSKQAGALAMALPLYVFAMTTSADDASAMVDAWPMRGDRLVDHDGRTAQAPLVYAILGHMALLAGRDARAVSLLGFASRACTVLPWSGSVFAFAQPRARLDLGTALERTGDKKGACDAYQLVVDQWGAAKPRSITAEAAKVRMRALGCGR